MGFALMNRSTSEYVRLQIEDLLGEVLLLDLIQLRRARGHDIIGWGYKRVPARNMSD